jgi:hypothetical protein
MTTPVSISAIARPQNVWVIDVSSAFRLRPPPKGHP